MLSKVTISAVPLMGPIFTIRYDSAHTIFWILKDAIGLWVTNVEWGDTSMPSESPMEVE